DERLMAVERVVATAEGDQGPLRGRHLNEDVVEVVGGAQQPEPPARPLPAGVHVDERGDELAGRVRVGVAVPGAAAAAPRDQGGPAREVDVKLLLERRPHLGAGQGPQQRAEGRAEGQARGGKAARVIDPGVIPVDRRPRLRPDEARDDQVVEGLPGQPGRPERIQVEAVHYGRFLSHGEAEAPAAPRIPLYRDLGRPATAFLRGRPGAGPPTALRGPDGGRILPEGRNSACPGCPPSFGTRFADFPVRDGFGAGCRDRAARPGRAGPGRDLRLGHFPEVGGRAMLRRVSRVLLLGLGLALGEGGPAPRATAQPPGPGGPSPPAAKGHPPRPPPKDEAALALHEAYDNLNMVSVWLGSKRAKLPEDEARLAARAEEFYRAAHRSYQGRDYVRSTAQALAALD